MVHLELCEAYRDTESKTRENKEDGERNGDRKKKCP